MPAMIRGTKAIGMVLAGATAWSASALDLTDPTLGVGLQAIVDDLTVSGPGLNIVTDSVPVELFVPNGAIVTSSFITEQGETSSSFGLSPKGDAATMVEVFAGGNDVGDVASVAISIASTQVVTIKVAPGAVNPVPEINNYGVTFNGAMPFGLYVQQEDGDKFFSESALPDASASSFLILQGDGLTTLDLPGVASSLFGTDEFIVGFDTGSGTYTDMVVAISGISAYKDVYATPTPTAAAAGIMGLMVVLSRRRQDQQD